MSSFDVLQGLVFAIDTKDRYTKRHSEDVARYGVFLGHRLGLDDATLGRIHVAGLLHDVGKIGIPDGVLRKPGKLTADEYEAVKQHVALGDLIVRDLPDIDEIRAGIRHHHERWDGRGYLHALAAEDIPLIARILAVGDAFSAMTTTRPYRKALDVREALPRLGDAAGTQLDERLVTAFIRGIESAPDAPMPGAAVPRARASGRRGGASRDRVAAIGRRRDRARPRDAAAGPVRGARGAAVDDRRLADVAHERQPGRGHAERAEHRWERRRRRDRVRPDQRAGLVHGRERVGGLGEGRDVRGGPRVDRHRQRVEPDDRHLQGARGQQRAGRAAGGRPGRVPDHRDADGLGVDELDRERLRQGERWAHGPEVRLGDVPGPEPVVQRLGRLADPDADACTHAYADTATDACPDPGHPRRCRRAAPTATPKPTAAPTATPVPTRRPTPTPGPTGTPSPTDAGWTHADRRIRPRRRSPASRRRRARSRP